MNWFNNIFQNRSSGKNNEIKVLEETQKGLMSDFTSRTSPDLFFSGLDYDFINFIYFKDETEKIKFICDIEMLVKELKINHEINMVVGRKKVFDHNNDADNRIPFLNEIICYNSYITTTIEEFGKEKTVKTKFAIHDSLDNYYTALNLCSYNFQKKIENDFFDFKFENELVNKTLMNSQLYNFTRINTLFNLGDSFYKAGQIESMENVFNKIRSENYDLSSSRIASYYRYIEEIYIELKQDDKAVHWLKAGLLLNPKLGVKKLINKVVENDK